MSKYEEALKNLSCDVSNLCKEMGWEMDNKDIEVMKELIQVKSDLEAKLSLTEKALKLACELYWNDCGMEDCPADIMDNFTDTYEKCKTCPNGGDRFINKKGCCWVDYFKNKAKEIMSDNGEQV